MKYFTKVFRDALIADKNALASRSLRLVLFRTVPSGDGPYDYTLIPTVSGLIAGNYPGWELVDATSYTSPVTVNITLDGKKAYIFWDAFRLLTLSKKVEVAAVGVELVGNLWGQTDPLLFVSNEMFPDGRAVIDKDDALTSFPMSSTDPRTWLMSWDDNTGPPTPTAVSAAQRGASLMLGPLAMTLGPPDYQSSHHFHAWLYPQRVNYIANPSFEAVDNDYWGTSGTFSRVLSPAGGYAGKFTGSSVVVESNTFPIEPDNEGIWTIQLLIKGSGRLSLGLVNWSASYDSTQVDWGLERWDLSPTSFRQIKVTRKVFEAVEGMLRLQVEGGTDITIDKVLAEPGPLVDWRYFDGDDQYGAPDDFSWYGVRGKSYSLWYNNKRSILSRLFAKPAYTGTVFTEQDEHGLAYNWVPAGTVVEHHVDVLRPDDLKTAPQVKSGVMPDIVTDPVFGVPKSDQNVLTPQGSLVLTAEGEELYTAG